MKICAIVICIFWSNVNCILEFHTHVHRHHRPSNKKTDFRGHKKGNVEVSNIPSAGDGALNPWFYRFPPWTEHNPPPPTLALTNGDALKSPPNLRDISSLRRAPHNEERFVFNDVKVNLDMPYVNEVVKTVLATQGQSSEDDHLVYGEESDKGSYYPLSNVRQHNGLLNSYENSITSLNYPTKPFFSDQTSTDIVFLKTHDIFPLYEVYGKSKLDSKYIKQPVDFFFPEDRSQNPHQQDSFSIDSLDSVPLMFHENSIDSTQILLPKNQLSEKISEKTKNTRHFEEFGQTPRGLNLRLSSSLKDGSKYPTSIQDIINEQKPSQSNEFGYQIDPRHNRPSRQTRLSRRSRFLGSRWIWSDDPDR